MNLSRLDKQYMDDVCTFIEATIAADGVGNMIFCPCKDCMNHRKIVQVASVRSHLLMRGFMPNYRIWYLHGEVCVNVATNNDDVDMTDVHHHEDVNVAQTNNDENPVVNTQHVDATDNVFRNTLADDTEEDDGISLLLCNVETEFLSDSQLKKLEKMREDDKTPLNTDCPMTKLEANIMLLEFKSTNRLSDKALTNC